MCIRKMNLVARAIGKIRLLVNITIDAFVHPTEITTFDRVSGRVISRRKECDKGGK